MSSRCRAEISEAVREFLARLADDRRAEAREVALLLLRLEREPEPPGSRELEPYLVEPRPGERVWERPDWVISYWVDHREGIVVVASVKRGQR